MKLNWLLSHHVCHHRHEAILSPDPDELIEVVSAQDGGVPEKVKLRQVALTHGFDGGPGEVVEVVHDHSHKEVEHEEATEEDEGDEVGIGEV